MVRRRSLVSGAVKAKSAHEEAEMEGLTEEQLLKATKSFALYLLFLVVFSVVAFSPRSEHDYWANRAMTQLLVEKPFHFGTLASGTPAAPHEKTLRDVHTHEQFFYWLKVQRVVHVLLVVLVLVVLVAAVAAARLPALHSSTGPPGALPPSARRPFSTRSSSPSPEASRAVAALAAPR